jgi:hypothetical protein
MTIEGVEIIATPFLTSALVGAEWSASRPFRFATREMARGTHWIGGWVGPEAVRTPWRREKSCTAGNRTSD